MQRGNINIVAIYLRLYNVAFMFCVRSCKGDHEKRRCIRWPCMGVMNLYSIKLIYENCILIDMIEIAFKGFGVKATHSVNEVV